MADAELTPDDVAYPIYFLLVRGFKVVHSSGWSLEHCGGTTYATFPDGRVSSFKSVLAGLRAVMTDGVG